MSADPQQRLKTDRRKKAFFKFYKDKALWSLALKETRQLDRLVNQDERLVKFQAMKALGIPQTVFMSSADVQHLTTKYATNPPPNIAANLLVNPTPSTNNDGNENNDEEENENIP
ncbi:hypothetical protein McanCB49686_008109 [Microsporum canis]